MRRGMTIIAVSAAWIAPVLFGFPRAGDAQQPETLTVQWCLDSARERNLDLLLARQRLQEVEYDRWDVRSRFLPTVTLEGRYNRPDVAGLENSQFRDEAILRTQQRLLEFGADAQEDVTFRSQFRQVYYAAEQQVRRTLSGVRRNFYLAVLKQRQIESRTEVLKNVSDKLHRIRVMYERGVATEFDLLTAELDSLEQKVQIRLLEGESARLRFELLRLIGLEMTDAVVLDGTIEEFQLALDDAVKLALDRDVTVRRLMEDLSESMRAYRETRYAYVPDLDIEMGLQKGDAVASLDLSRSSLGRTWRLDLSTDLLLGRTGRLPLDSRFLDRDTDRFARFLFTVPIFSGLKRYGLTGAARERYHQATTSLSDRRNQVEREIRRLYQVLQDRNLQKEVEADRLAIARRRLEIQERLRGLGQATDNQVETFRDRFFQAQETLFRAQDVYIAAVEDLREAIGYFD